MIINRKNIVVFTYDALGMPQKPPQYSPIDWMLWWQRAEKLVVKYNIPWKQLIAEEMIHLPRVKIRLGRNGLVRCIWKKDYEEALLNIKKKQLIPTNRRIADSLGVSVTSLKRLCKRWNLVLPHAQPWRNNLKYLYKK